MEIIILVLAFAVDGSLVERQEFLPVDATGAARFATRTECDAWLKRSRYSWSNRLTPTPDWVFVSCEERSVATGSGS